MARRAPATIGGNLCPIRSAWSAIATGASSIALLAASPALAADAAADAGADAAAEADIGSSGGEIIVTAGWREERLQAVPTAVSALGADQFSLGGIGRSANEVLNYIPTPRPAPQQHGRPRWWIRGIGAEQQQLPDLASPDQALVPVGFCQRPALFFACGIGIEVGEQLPDDLAPGLAQRSDLKVPAQGPT